MGGNPERALRPDTIPALRAGGALTGAILTASAALAADLCQAHPAMMGPICGASSQPVCGWLVASVGLGLSAFAAFALAAAPAASSRRGL